MVLRTDGTLLASRGTPVEWFADALGSERAPLPVARAVHEACEDAVDDGVGFLTVPAAIDGKPVEVLVVAVDAVLLRRTLVPIDELVLRTMDLFVGQARSAAIELRVTRAPDMPAVLFGDGEKLAWVLATLVGNAIRAVGDVGGRAASGHVEVDVRYDPDSRAFVFEVSDDGPGMPEATVEWLFERDPRTGRAAGLALRMVKDVVAAHRGSIRVTSREGKGTRFYVTVPKGEPRRER